MDTPGNGQLAAHPLRSGECGDGAAWGVHPFLFGSVDSTDRLLSLCVECARKEEVVSAEDTVVITAGVPIGQSGTTNLIKAQVVGEKI